MLQPVTTEIVENVDFERDSTKAPVAGPGIDENALFGDIFEDDSLRGVALVSCELDLAVGAFAHVFDDCKVLDCFLAF